MHIIWLHLQPTCRFHKNLKCWCLFLHFTLFVICFLVLSTPCSACSLVCIYMRMCVYILAELYRCAQTTLCVNSSLLVGGRTPLCVSLCVYVCVDWWGHSRVPGLLTTPPSPLPSAPVPPSHRSVPSAFNLAAKDSGSESHRGTLLIFKHHTHASFPVLSPCLTTLPSLLPPPRSPHSSSPQFCLHFNFSRLLPCTDAGSIQPGWCQTSCHFVLCSPLFFLFHPIS